MTAQDRALCKVSIMKHEGFSPRPVADAHGTQVIGYGYNLQRGPALTEPQGQFLLEGHLDQRESDLLRAWPLFASCYGSTAQALLEMAYQLGVSGLLLFPRLLHCVAVGDRDGAAREVLNAQLAQQTPARALDYAALLREHA